MGRTVVRRVEPPPSRRAMDGGVLLGGAVVLVFAVIGVISTAVFLGGRLSSAPAPVHHRGTPSAIVAAQDIGRARAQATAIVRAAQDAGKSAGARQIAGARQQAATIIRRARARAAAIIAAANVAPAAAPVAQSPPVTQPAAPVVPAAPAPAIVPTTVSSGTLASPGQPSTPNLSGVPASWLVVAYNATFGTGPGSAGSISVVNRSSTTFSGVAQVVYESPHGSLGIATAPFSGLGPGQAEVLPLSGAAYPSGATGYQIEVVDLH